MNRLNDAINICLTTIGEPPLAEGASITGNFEAETASTAIDEALIEVLSHGYQFNTDEDYPLSPSNGTIVVPEGVLAIDASQSSSDYIVKEGNLYDKTNLSSVFTEPVKVNITWNTDFDDLHTIPQLLVVASAKAKLYSRVVGVDNMVNLLLQEVQDAKTALLREEIQSGDYSIFDAADTRRAMNRTQNPNAL